MVLIIHAKTTVSIFGEWVGPANPLKISAKICATVVHPRCNMFYINRNSATPKLRLSVGKSLQTRSVVEQWVPAQNK